MRRALLFLFVAASTRAEGPASPSLPRLPQPALMEPSRLRQAEVLHLVASGLSNREIAEDMGIAERTVKAHLNRYYLEFRIKDGIKRIKLALAFAEPEPPCVPLPELSELERGIVAGVVAGKKNRQIADELGETENVVKNHEVVIMEKFGAESRLRLALAAVRYPEFAQHVSFRPQAPR